jgi:hypothetical protein
VIALAGDSATRSDEELRDRLLVLVEVCGHDHHHGEEEQPGGDRPQAGYGRLGSFSPLASLYHCAIVHDGEGTSRPWRCRTALATRCGNE